MGCIKVRGISTKAAAQIRMGIATGELIYNLIVKDENLAANTAMYKAGRTPKRTYLATIRTVAKLTGCAN